MNFSTTTIKHIVNGFSPSFCGLYHAVQQFVDLVLAVAVVTALHKVIGLLVEAATRVAQLERPQEVGDLLEVGSNRPDLSEVQIVTCEWKKASLIPNLMDHVFNANDVVFAQVAFHNIVVGEWLALPVLLHVSTLVDQLTDALLAGIAPCNEGVSNAQHLK
jgi:hypothetical protein